MNSLIKNGQAVHQGSSGEAELPGDQYPQKLGKKWKKEQHKISAPREEHAAMWRMSSIILPQKIWAAQDYRRH
ncbi:MAG: hypothetical protein HXS46_20875 [Theionarchaea archaeon]|nr:hypothetical protein [Theionarchaea archaeon]